MTGDELAARLASPPPPLPALIEDFLYERTTFMITGEAGKGKSVLASQIAVSLSSATPLFGQLLIPIPRRVYYLQLEGAEHLFLTRLYYQQEICPIIWKNFYWDRDVRFNCLTPVSRNSKLSKMEAFGSPDLIIIDPIYKCVAGDLAKAEIALGFIYFLEQLEERFHCTVLCFHHPHRERLDYKGKRVEELDAYYGHSFIRNHMDTTFVFHQLSADGQESELIRTKLREENILPQLSLIYHPETYTCSMLPSTEQGTKRELLVRYLAECSLQHKTTSITEIKTRYPHVSTTTIREVQAEMRDKGWLSLEVKSGHRTIWKPQFPTSENTNEK